MQTKITIEENKQRGCAINPPASRPIIDGLIAAISATCRGYRPQWEALRSLWNHKALTWDEFQWLEHLEIVLGQQARASEFGVTALPGGPGWNTIVDLTNASVASSVQFESDRKAHGLQFAFDRP